MKIWLPVITGGSGTDVFTRRLADALQRRGIAAEITWFSSHYQFTPFLLRSAPPPPGTTVTHANSWNGFVFKRIGIPLVVTEHLNVLDPSYRPYKTLAQSIYHETLIRRFVLASYRVASAIIAVSRSVASSLSKTLSVRTAHVIPNWIDTKTFFPLEQNTGPKHRPFRLLFVGNLSRRKGADLLAPIMRELGSEFELCFTSGLRQPRAIRIEKNMSPLGRITDDRELARISQRCEALLFPSLFEGFGLAALEAMACGKPVIASNTSSLPEVVEDGVSGILCPPDDIGAFVTACQTLAENPKILHQYGEAARRRAVDLFSEDLIIPQYIRLYERLIRG